MTIATGERRGLRIALFHNLGPGGAKRHLYEQARGLHARGHTLDLFVPATADESYLPLTPFCTNVKVYGGELPLRTTDTMPIAALAPRSSSLRRLAQTGFAKPLAEALWRRRAQNRLSSLANQYAAMAWDINIGSYDALYVHHCRQMLAPDLLRLARHTPTVFCCHDTPRALVEWPVAPELGYDNRRETRALRLRRGRILTPAALSFGEREVQHFETNTRAAGTVLANSYYSRECLARVAGVDARVCYPGVDSEYFTPLSDPERTHTVLSVGALLPAKRHDLVIRAVGHLPRETRPGVEVIGYESRADGRSGISSEGERLDSLAVELGVSLTIRREVTDAVLRDAYQRAGVVAFTPYLEPFGLVAIEAMACGAAVVGVREGGIRETVRDGETGILTDVDAAAFAAAISRVLSDSALARRMGERGRASAVADWSWERSTDTAESYLYRAAGRGL